MAEVAVMPESMFHSGRESIHMLPVNELATVRRKELNRKPLPFYSTHLTFEDISADDYYLQGEGFSSNSSDGFNDRTLTRHNLTDNLRKVGAKGGIIFSNQNHNAHQNSHFIMLVPKNPATHETVFIGVAPTETEVDQIEWVYNSKKKQLDVSFVKRTDNVINQQREWEWEIVSGRGDQEKLSEEYRKRFKQKIEAVVQKYNLPSTKTTRQNSWFSWPHYGKWIDQKLFEQEVEKLKELPQVEQVILDDGWFNRDNYGDWEFDTTDFPNPLEMIRKVHEAKKRLCLWVGPFLVDKSSEFMQQHPDWVMKDEKNPKKFAVTNTFHIQKYLKKGKGIVENATKLPIKILEGVHGVDISIPEARQHIIQQIVALAQMGVDDFKLDFLGAPFVGKQRNTDKTMLEYEYQFFSELRSALKDYPDVRLMGCTMPLILAPFFDTFRITNDSSAPTALLKNGIYREIIDHTAADHLLSSPALRVALLGILKSNFLPNSKTRYKSIKEFFTVLNTVMYEDAASVLEKRLAFWGDVFKGGVADGMHIPQSEAGHLFFKAGIEQSNQRLLDQILKHPWINMTIADKITDDNIETWREILAKVNAR